MGKRGAMPRSVAGKRSTRIGKKSKAASKGSPASPKDSPASPEASPPSSKGGKRTGSFDDEFLSDCDDTAEDTHKLLEAFAAHPWDEHDCISTVFGPITGRWLQDRVDPQTRPLCRRKCDNGPFLDAVRREGRIICLDICWWLRAS